MNYKLKLSLLGIVILGLITASCTHIREHEHNTKLTVTNVPTVVLKDYGAEPMVLNIDDYTMANGNFRTALWTGSKLQVTVMSIPVGDEVGLESHPDTDQFLRIEDGVAKVLTGNSKDALSEKAAVADFAIFIPAGTWHNIINTGDKPLKLYSIYSPPHHPHGTVHKTRSDEIEQEHSH